MHKQENTNQEPAFKLSGNNSLLTLSDGRKFQINVDSAISELLDCLPKDIKLSDLHQHVFMIKDHITDTLPEDVSIPMYKSMNAQLNAYAGFFAALFYTEKGGRND